MGGRLYEKREEKVLEHRGRECGVSKRPYEVWLGSRDHGEWEGSKGIKRGEQRGRQRLKGIMQNVQRGPLSYHLLL